MGELDSPLFEGSFKVARMTSQVDSAEDWLATARSLLPGVYPERHFVQER